MKPGRELDAIVAEHVMGYVYDDGSYLDEICKKIPPKPYSTDISAAWEVVEEFANIEVTLTAYGVWHCRLGGYVFKNKGTSVEKPTGVVVFMDSDESAPHAICLAALKASGYDYTSKPE